MYKRFERDHSLIIEVANCLKEVYNEGNCIVGFNTDGWWTAVDALTYMEPILKGQKVDYSVLTYKQGAVAVIRTYY